jgi:glyceraldehyde 3-phosphate dehydrogenase
MRLKKRILIMMNIAINGFGRIGKSFFRALLQDKEARKYINVALINIGKGDPQASAFALKYDTLMGTYDGPVEYDDGYLHVDSYRVPIIAQLDPEKAPWKSYGIDWVVEASGHFTKREGAAKHLAAGAKAVLITAPAQGEDITIIPGVNLERFNPQVHKIVSLGSCTTNALATMLKVVEDSFGIEQACMTTVHAYTNTQALLDVDPTLKDLRRSRAAALNIVPTTTGAMEVIDRIIPTIKGKITGYSLRVPVAKVSLIDLTAWVTKPTSTENLNTIFKKVAQESMVGIVEFTLEPLVSSDYAGNNHSAVIDGLMTEVHGTVCKVFGWYDNEWGYSVRLKDFLLKA